MESNYSEYDNQQVEPPSTLHSMILIQSEDEARDTLANEEAIDYGLILAKHMSLLPQEMLELSVDPQSWKRKSS